MLMKSHLDYVCRIAAGLDPKIDRTKIKVVDGKSKPRVMGQTARTVDASGNPVQHANAYRKAGGRTRNEESTRRIEVGEKWLRALLEQALDAHDAWHDSKLAGPAKPLKAGKPYPSRSKVSYPADSTANTMHHADEHGAPPMSADDFGDLPVEIPSAEDNAKMLAFDPSI